MRVIFHPAARAEFTHDIRYYAAQRRGLGIRFRNIVQEIIQRILANPQRGRIVEANVRRCLTPIFQHAVHYIVTEDTLFIVATGHCRREPGYWKDRLDKP
jgi:toxin ParE1/3/4